MSELVGMLHGREIYDDDPQLTELVCDWDYAAVRNPIDGVSSSKRCDYCRRKGQRGDTCESCGAAI